MIGVVLSLDVVLSSARVPAAATQATTPARSEIHRACRVCTDAVLVLVANRDNVYFAGAWISAIYPPGNCTIAESLRSELKGSMSTVAPEVVAFANVAFRSATS